METKEKDKWWYSNDENEKLGPVTTYQFLSLFQKGQVDGVTKVSKQSTIPLSQWNQLSEQPDLRDVLLTSAPTSPPPEEKQTHSTMYSPSSSILPNIYDISEKEHNSNPNPHPQLTPHAQILRNRFMKRMQIKRKRLETNKPVNTSVYVTKLPKDVTIKELETFFSKCGLILRNHQGKPRIKIYQDEQGLCKGDALVTYALQPSVENAINILDGALLRDNHLPIAVQLATFDHKKQQHTQNEQNDTKRQRSALRKADFIAEALNWADEDDEQNKYIAPSAQRIVILQNVFDPNNVDYALIKDDMFKGCKPYGKIEKVTIFEKSPQGVVAVKFTTIQACLDCISVMNNRWYDGRCITAEIYDGKSDYRHKETDEEKKERDDKWKQWLEGEEDLKEDGIDTRNDSNVSPVQVRQKDTKSGINGEHKDILQNDVKGTDQGDKLRVDDQMDMGQRSKTGNISEKQVDTNGNINISPQTEKNKEQTKDTPKDRNEKIIEQDLEHNQSKQTTS